MRIGDNMGLFDKFKRILKVNTEEEKKELQSYDQGLEKTTKEMRSKLAQLSKRHKQIDDAYFEELEDILITADIGVHTVMSFMDRLKKRVKEEAIQDVDDLREIIVDEMFVIYVNNQILVNKINYNQDGLTVLLFVGVNGVGKTTTIGKLANKLRKEGKKVLLIAGDTFRAGATEQLVEWANRTHTDVVWKENRDPLVSFTMA